MRSKSVLAIIAGRVTVDMTENRTAPRAAVHWVGIVAAFVAPYVQLACGYPVDWTALAWLALMVALLASRPGAGSVRQRVGLPPPDSDAVIRAFAIGMVLFAITRFTGGALSVPYDRQFDQRLRPIGTVVPFVFQALHFELFVGSVLLGAGRLRVERPVLVAVAAGALTGLVPTLYFGLVTPGRWLSPVAMIALVGTGVLRAANVLDRHHVLTACAMHVGFTVASHRSVWIFRSSGSEVDGAVFTEVMFGTWGVLAICCVAAGTQLWLLARRRVSSPPSSPDPVRRPS
ncbi:MAG: hypothetical protein IPM29_15170 [Planctomycetes bacterium]|nr:hypothetical protein [Planctomycetota bacterium]